MVCAVFACLMLAACASLPRITPDMARGPVLTANGGTVHPLSTAHSTRIVEELKSKGVNADMLEQHLALEEAIGGEPLVQGNQVRLLEDGPKTYEAMFQAIRKARHHINLESFIVEGDEIGQQFADLLVERRAEGVEVNLIYDSVGSHSTPREFFRRLKDAGINILEFNPINPLTAKQGWNLNQRDHRKLLIVDGKVAFVGGVNISSVYSSASSAKPMPSTDRQAQTRIPWRDTHLRVEGPVVANFQKLFVDTWIRQKGPPLSEARYFPRLPKRGDAVVRAIGSSPDDGFSLIYVTLISAINSAGSQVYLTNAYFVPDPQLLEALCNAALRGVDVRLVLPAKSDSALVYRAGRAYYTPLLEAGVKIYERRNALLHAKTALVDGVWATVGSTNLDWRSFLHNQEINAAVVDKAFAEQMYAAFQADMQASREITLDEWKRRSILERIGETGARLWAYWL